MPALSGAMGAGTVTTASAKDVHVNDEIKADPSRSILEQAFPPILGASDQAPAPPPSAVTGGDRTESPAPIVFDRYSDRTAVVNLPPFESQITIVYNQDWTPVGLNIDRQWFRLLLRPTGTRYRAGEFHFPIAQRSVRSVVKAAWHDARLHARERGLKLPADDPDANTATIARWTADLLSELDREWEARIAARRPSRARRTSR